MINVGGSGYISGSICMHLDCNNKTGLGYCKTTGCINPKYNHITNIESNHTMTEQEIYNLSLKEKEISYGYF